MLRVYNIKYQWHGRDPNTPGPGTPPIAKEHDKELRHRCKLCRRRSVLQSQRKRSSVTNNISEYMDQHCGGMRRSKMSRSDTALDLLENEEADNELAHEGHDGYHDDFEFVHDDFELSSGVRRATVAAA